MARRAKPAEAAPAGSNTDPDKVAACYAEYASLMTDQARVAQRMAAMFARYEKDGGVDKKAVKHAYSLASKDPAEATRQHARNSEYVAILGIITVEANGQSGVSEAFAPRVAKPSTAAQAQLNAARAHADGYNTGLAGGEIGNCQHSPGSEEFVSWRDGWSDGNADRLARNPEKAGETTPAPRDVSQIDIEEAIAQGSA